jgi:sulfoxide reductase heme-binding subunit YedZ
MAQWEHSSYWRRRILRHAMIGFATLALTSLFWKLFSVRTDRISHLSIATAYPALLLTAAALVLGPWNVLRHKANPVSFDLRRDSGIWAGIMALVHLVLG